MIRKLSKYIPNTLTLTRAVLVIPFAYLLNLYLSNNTGYPKLLAIFVLIAVTDILDGCIARKLDAATELGALLDVAADSLFAIIATIVLFKAGIVCFEYLLIMISKLAEFFITSQMLKGNSCKKKNLVFDFLGKMSGILFIAFPMIACTFLRIDIMSQVLIRIGIISIATISLLSFIHRIRLIHQLRQA